MRYSLNAVIDTLASAGFGCIERSGREDGVTTHIIAVSESRVAEFALSTGCIVNVSAGNIVKSNAHPVQMVRWLRGGKC